MIVFNAAQNDLLNYRMSAAMKSEGSTWNLASTHRIHHHAAVCQLSSARIAHGHGVMIRPTLSLVVAARSLPDRSQDCCLANLHTSSLAMSDLCPCGQQQTVNRGQLVSTHKVSRRLQCTVCTKLVMMRSTGLSLRRLQHSRNE